MRGKAGAVIKGQWEGPGYVGCVQRHDGGGACTNLCTNLHTI